MKTKIIVLRGKPMTQNEIDEALLVSPNTPWYRAITQLINDQAMDCLVQSVTCTGVNNASGAAMELGGWKSLDNLIFTLDEKRASE